VEALYTQVRGGSFGGREQQVCPSVDRGAIFLLRPGEARIVCSQACFDMRDRNVGEGASERCAKRARGVALHYEEVRCRAQQQKHCSGDHAHMPVRVFVSPTPEAHRGIRLKPEFAGIESEVLAGEHERRRQAAIAQRMGDRRQLDGFRPGPDDQPYVGETQPSP
jgi:hypothetical protein